MRTPPPHCWIHPDVRVAPSRVEGRGLFAAAPLSEGEPVSRLGGSVVPVERVRALIAARAQDASLPYVDCITWDERHMLVLPPDQLNHFANHSCDPNLWWEDEITLVARQGIHPGQELTNDYGTSSGDPEFVMRCRCGSGLCRGVVTGLDWRLPELRTRYGHHWVPALLRLIEGGGARTRSSSRRPERR
jgi:uncharacterized protein